MFLNYKIFRYRSCSQHKNYIITKTIQTNYWAKDSRCETSHCKCGRPFSICYS
jgi:hypothetical protein